MNSVLLRPIMLFIPLLLGAFLPQASALQWLVKWILIFMLFMSCLQIRFTQLKPKPFHWYLLIVNLLLAVVPYFLIRFLAPGYPDIAQAAFFLGIAPTATAAPVIISFMNGRVHTVLTGFVISNVLISLSLLFLLPVITGNFTTAFVSKVAQDLLFIIGFPIALATVIRLFYPKAKEWPAKCKRFTFLIFSLMLFIMSAIARQYFIDNPDGSLWVVMVILLLSLLSAIINFTLGAWIGPKIYKRESSQMLGQKNTNLALYLALTFTNPLVAMGPVFYVFWHNLWNAYQIFRYDHRKHSKKKKRQTRKKHEHSSGHMKKSSSENSGE